MLGNYLQQTTSADDIFRCIFFGALRVKATYTKVNEEKSISNAYAKNRNPHTVRVSEKT